MSITFEGAREPDGLRIIDKIENTRFKFETPDPVYTTPAQTDLFYFPVDETTWIETSALVTPKLLDVYIRDANSGEMLAQSSNDSGLEIEGDEYNVEVVTSEMKLYLHVESAVVVTRGEATVTIDFGDETRVTVGARSYHERPAHSITVPKGIGPAMEAVSTFGSALKTLTPERSYPTLRGHPPLVRFGPELEIPDEIDVPDTGVTIRIPPEWDALFTVASLAYYLGARVAPTDDEPRLVTETGFEHPLDGEGGFEETVARTLKQVFFLDCITRTEGYYTIDLHERRLTEPEVDLDFAELYDKTIAEQLEAYLQEEYATIEAAMPTWKQTADVWPSPEQVKALPYAANDLALIRCPNLPESADPNPAPKGVVDFFRSAESGDGGEPAGPIIQPDPTDSLEHVWFGEGYPMGANKASIQAYRRQFDVEPRDDYGIDVAVVCNDPKMADEQDAIAEIYGESDDRNFDVTHYQQMTTGDLRELLGTEMDFLHFVGHVKPEGIECVDGLLDVNELEWAGPKAFILNGCESYPQAQALVEKGSLGGVATLSRVGNQSAVEVGKRLARLLNHGYPLGAGLVIATEDLAIGSHYSTFGAVQVELVRTKGVPDVIALKRDGDVYKAKFKPFPSGNSNIGGHVIVNIGEVTHHNLDGRTVGQIEVTPKQLDDYLDGSIVPLEIDGRFIWSDTVVLDDL